MGPQNYDQFCLISGIYSNDEYCHVDRKPCSWIFEILDNLSLHRLSFIGLSQLSLNFDNRQIVKINYLSFEHSIYLNGTIFLYILKALSGHYWELILNCLQILITLILKKSGKNERSSPSTDSRIHQLLIKTSKVRYLQVFSKLVESAFFTDKMNKFNEENQLLY